MVLAQNKKALFDYELIEKYEAGLMLTGYEVKAAKGGQINLKGSFVTFKGNTPLLTNCHISLYKPAGPMPDYIPDRSRPLLLKKREIAYLRAKSQEKGLTIVPVKVYTKNRFIKVEIAVARGKKEFDKRASVKKREINREINRILKK